MSVANWMPVWFWQYDADQYPRIADRVVNVSMNEFSSGQSSCMAKIVVDDMMDGSIRPLDPSVAAQISIGLVNAAAELTRWAPNTNAENGTELYVRPIFLDFVLSVEPIITSVNYSAFL